MLSIYGYTLTYQKILVPLLRNVEEAKNLVQSAKFPPLGKRGFGSPLAMERFNPIPSMTEYLQQANSSLLTMVQIETKEALDAVDEIAAVDGIDVLFIGPFDLGKRRLALMTFNCAKLLTVSGNNIGHPIVTGTMDPELKEAIARILEATRKAGKKCGIYCSTGEQAKVCADQGFDMINVATDFTSLTAIASHELSVAKNQTVPGRGLSY